MAARRGHGEMAIGNIFGSNIFNILMVLGITSLIHPLNISEPINPDLIIATGMTSLLLALIVFGKHSLGNISGATLLATYFLYITLKGVGTF
jgi:cation:H+ antiporter